MVCIAMLSLASNGMGEELTTGSSSRKLKQEVIKQIPWAQLNNDTKSRIGDVLDKPSMYRSLPRMAIQIDPDYLQFLIRHPEVVVSIWELMGITEMKAKRVGPYQLETDDGAGTTSDMELVYGSSDTHIYYGEGQYEGPVLRKKLDARCVIVVRTSPRNQVPVASPLVNKPRQMICQLDVFLKIQNTTAGLIVRTIQPIVGPTADHNFVESMKFLQRLNETTENNGYGVQEMGRKLGVDRPVQEKFIALAGVVHQRATARESSGHPGKYNIDFKESRTRQSAGGTVSPVNAHPIGVHPVSPTYPVRQSSYATRPGTATSKHTPGRSQPGKYRYPAQQPRALRSGFHHSIRHALFSDQH